MALHELKTDPAVFDAVYRGDKTFEIRLDDRGFAVGDMLHLRETLHTGEAMRDSLPLKYTGRDCLVKVSHITRGYGLQNDWVCMSFREVMKPADAIPSTGG